MFQDHNSVLDVTIVLLGELATILIFLSTELYRKCKGMETKRIKVLCNNIKKELYGYIWSTILFYKKLSGKLKNFGFQVKPYGPRVTNKTMDG